MTDVIALAFYTPETYAAMRAVADDRGEDGWKLTYSEFVTKCDRIAAGFARQGIRVERVLLDVDDCVRWCRRNGLRVDQKGRATYGTAVACARDEGLDHVPDLAIGDPAGAA